MAWYDDIFGSGVNIFGAAPPSYLGGEGGLLNTAEMAKLKQQSLMSGLLNTGLTYLAQPKNQRYGSALPYLAKAGIAGVGASQNVYDQASQDYMTKAKIEEMQAGKTYTTQLLNDPRVKGRPELEMLARKDPAKLFEYLNPKKSFQEFNGNFLAINPYTDEITTVQKGSPNYNTLDVVKLIKFHDSLPEGDPNRNAIQKIIDAFPKKETPKDTFKILSPADIKSIEKKQGITIDTTRGQVYQQNTVTQQISPVGNQMESPVKPTSTITDKDKVTVNVVLEKLGVPKPSEITTTAIASRANQIMTQTGDDQFTAIQKATAEFQKSKAITTNTNWLGSKSTDFTIKKPLDSFYKE